MLDLLLKFLKGVKHGYKSMAPTHVSTTYKNKNEILYKFQYRQ